MDKKIHGGGESWSQERPHEHFLELCAVSTSGELAAEEQRELEVHLNGCAECRQALKEFQATVDRGVPSLYPYISAPENKAWADEANSLPAGASEAASAPARRLQAEQEYGREYSPEHGGEHGQGHSALTFARRNGHHRSLVSWNFVWMSLAAVVLLTVALGLYSYQVGVHRAKESVGATPAANGGADARVDIKIEALERQMSDAGHERELLKAQLAERDRTIAELRRGIETQSAALNDRKKAASNWAQSREMDEAEKQQAAQERTSLLEKAGLAQASLEKAQAELDALRRERSRDESAAESLKAQIGDLQAQLHEREQAIGRQEDLLAHDRDIRELMGARDLYIAEVYDVGRDGTTQKPYGRVFYTKGKSLIFYAYDLDQQAGRKNASTFQAWGNRGADREQAASLGIFYQDSAAKKRWVVKCDNPKTLEQIDAVFVTVEPSGGSHRPSGKPLLFAYLKLNPNHP